MNTNNRFYIMSDACEIVSFSEEWVIRSAKVSSDHSEIIMQSLRRSFKDSDDITQITLAEAMIHADATWIVHQIFNALESGGYSYDIRHGIGKLAHYKSQGQLT